jgi:hypothetical protein
MRFEKYLDQKVALGDMDNVLTGIGSYKGQLEVCYLMKRKDFSNWVQDSQWVMGQESYAVIPGDTKQSVTLWTFNDKYLDNPGPMKQLTDGAMIGDWTYIDGKYWQF